jgi:hypothetical protein
MLNAITEYVVREEWTMSQDVIDGLKLIASGVQSVRTVAEAIKSGRDYVKAKHPEGRKR